MVKLIGSHDRRIAGMILQQALGLGLIGFVVGKVAATVWAPLFPKYLLLEPGDALRGLGAVMLICALAVVRLLNQMAVEHQTAIIVVTHDEKIIPTFKRIYHIRDGRRRHRPVRRPGAAALVAVGLPAWLDPPRNGAGPAGRGPGVQARSRAAGPVAARPPARLVAGGRRPHRGR